MPRVAQDSGLDHLGVLWNDAIKGNGDYVAYDRVRRFPTTRGGHFYTRRRYSIEEVNSWYLENKRRRLGVPLRYATEDLQHNDS